MSALALRGFTPPQNWENNQTTPPSLYATRPRLDTGPGRGCVDYHLAAAGRASELSNPCHHEGDFQKNQSSPTLFFGDNAFKSG